MYLFKMLTYQSIYIVQIHPSLLGYINLAFYSALVILNYTFLTGFGLDEQDCHNREEGGTCLPPVVASSVM